MDNRTTEKHIRISVSRVVGVAFKRAMVNSGCYTGHLVDKQLDGITPLRDGSAFGRTEYFFRLPGQGPRPQDRRTSANTSLRTSRTTRKILCKIEEE